MISEAASYFANRLTETAAERLGPTIVWVIFIALGALAAVTFGLVALYAYLAPIYGNFHASAGIAVGAVLFTVALIVGRWIHHRILRNAESKASRAEETLHSVDEESRDAVDYFGSAKVLATAFMFGFTAARKIKG